MDKAIQIENRKVLYSELSDREKYLVNQIEDINLKIANLQFQADQLTAAKQLFSVELVNSQNQTSETEPKQ
jgi:hypothetical protein